MIDIKVYPDNDQRVNKWLDNKVEDECIESEYDNNKYTLPRYGYIDDYEHEPISTFDRYYNEGDIDIESKNSLYYLDAINETEYEDSNILTFLNKYVERYKSDDELINILILPNTNRYHCNYLLKNIIDYAYESKYNIKNKHGKIKKIKIFDKCMKVSFYNLCYINTFKQRRI